MARSFQEMTDFLVGLGTAEIPHSGTRFFSHLTGVHRMLKDWGCPEHVALAGLFHAVYGTQTFDRHGLPLERRHEVRDLIGERAERLAYANCALVRESIDASVASGGPPQLWDRYTDGPLPIREEEFEDLLTLHLCDRLEQVARSGNWEWRREAWEQMARRLGGVAEETFERVYAGH
jgi:(p)ppGpp synthase/HD superfamily hydrolase